MLKTQADSQIVGLTNSSPNHPKELTFECPSTRPFDNDAPADFPHMLAEVYIEKPSALPWQCYKQEDQARSEGTLQHEKLGSYHQNCSCDGI